MLGVACGRRAREVSKGVSAPRNVTCHPRRASRMPRKIRPRSWAPSAGRPARRLAPPGAPVAGHPEQAAPNEVRGEVLLGHADPPTAHRSPSSRRYGISTSVSATSTETVPNNDPGGMRPGRVESLDGRGQTAVRVPDQRTAPRGFTRPGRRPLPASRAASAAERPSAISALVRPHPRLVSSGRQPEAARRARRTQQVVALFPRPKQFRRHAGPPGELPDPHQGLHARSVYITSTVPQQNLDNIFHHQETVAPEQNFDTSWRTDMKTADCGPAHW